MDTLPVKNIILLILSCTGCLSLVAQEKSFPVVTQKERTVILYDITGPKLDSISAYLLAADIERVTSYRPLVVTDRSKVKGNVIIIGTAQTSLIKNLSGKRLKWGNYLRGKREIFAFQIIGKPLPNIKKALIIAGSDARGTAYGVFTISEKLGISPWYWWADVPVKKQKQVTLNIEPFVSHTPSIKYRGIFINDEDWGLQPWAAKSFEPETGNIGPKTYARVFELLLRLKANLIWPAMHPGTKAFFSVPGNRKIAEDFQVVVGSSHAEPMLRNNVGEWNEKTMGAFNYFTNNQKIIRYWEDRVKESSDLEAIYTMGMRGVHDGQMEGIKTPKEGVPALESIFKDQRALLSRYIHKSIDQIPQAFTAYKEVLDIYDNGLTVPEDITLVWPDDNYGYIQRLNTKQEEKRSGRAGVYYHASYWGRPHDYLWLPSAHPALMQEEMMKAYHSGADRIWVLNVGDIKPQEYNAQFFLDMAYHTKPFEQSNYPRQHMQQWFTRQFGTEKGKRMADMLWRYYQLAFKRKPEFMGWSQVEPTTNVKYSAFNHFQFGDEAQKRIDQFELLEHQVRDLRRQCTQGEEAAFYQLVYYPVMMASWMNKKFLYRDKAYLYGKQNRISTFDYALRAKASYDSIVRETKNYNEQLQQGKWKGIMSMEPRKLPVYLAPSITTVHINKGTGWDVLPEGYDTTDYVNSVRKKLPVFTYGSQQTFFIDVFLTDSANLTWMAKASAPWIHLSSCKGVLSPYKDLHSIRLWVQVDWTKVPDNKRTVGSIEFETVRGKKSIEVITERPQSTGYGQYTGFVEENKRISMFASHYSDKRNKPSVAWNILQNLGHTGKSVQATRLNDSAIPDSNQVQSSAYLSYDFYSLSFDTVAVTIYTLPTNPLNKNFSMRYGVQLDNGPVKIVDFRTAGRSEEWKQNVLRNEAVRTFNFEPLLSEKHTLKVYAIDPGVILDRILITFGKVSESYGVIPQTWKN